MRYVCTVENGRTVPIDIHRILVPVDFSEASEAALEYAIDLAARHGARIDVLHVWELPPYPAMGQYVGHAGDTHASDGQESFAQHVHALATQRLNELLDARRQAGVVIEGIIESGEAITVIPRLAERYDLIVMGAHDDDSAKGLLFGNVADHVAGDVDRTVVTVRRENERESQRELRRSIPSRA